MTDEDETVQQCQLDKQLDLSAALDAVGIEHLAVDENRTIVIYQQALIMLTVTINQAETTQDVTAELWEPPADNSDYEPEKLLTAVIDELLATTRAT